jgi:hypothetical protein
VTAAPRPSGGALVTRQFLPLRSTSFVIFASPLSRFRAFTRRFVVGHHQFNGTHPERAREVIQRHDRRIAPTTLEATDILLGNPGHLGEALLGEALRQPQPCKISANQPAHVHARKLNEYTLSGLSHIMCIRGRWKTFAGASPSTVIVPYHRSDNDHACSKATARPGAT